MTQPAPSLDGDRFLEELGWVRRLARSLVRDAAIAEDVVHEAWLLARLRPPRAESPGSLRAWLSQVTRTLVRSRLRAEEARSRRERAVSLPEASDREPLDIVARTELQQRLVAAVMALQEPIRSAVLLRYVDELSAREIARRQGTSVANARQRVARGLALLRRDLDRAQGGDGRAWVLALVPLLELRPSVTSFPFVGGALTMKSSHAIVALLTLTTLGALALSQTWDRPEPRLATGPVLDAAAPPETAVVRAAEAPAPAAPALAGRNAVEARAAVPTPRASVRARLLDARGVPLATAELAVERAEHLVARADEHGRVELELPLPLPLRTDALGTPVVGFLARAEDHGAILRFERAPEESAVLELGDLRLVPIGAVAVVVRDELGQAIPGAEVRLTGPTAEAAGPAGERLFAPRHQMGYRHGRTDAEGRFLFEEVAEELWRVWAGAPGRAWEASAPLRIERGAPAEELVLVLRPLPPRNTIVGRVIGPDAVGLAGVQVSGAREGQAEIHALTGTDGGFLLNAVADEPYCIHAREGVTRGAEPRFGPATLTGVHAGEGPVTLALSPARWLELDVVDAEGKRVQANASTRYGSSGEQYDSSDTGRGRIRVLVPDQSFRVVIAAAGYDGAELGPFEPYRAPAEVRVVLARLARLRGVARAGGETVAGARVQLIRTAEGREVDYLYGFPTHLDGRGLEGTMTDAGGRFELPIRSEAEYVVLVEREGFATLEHGPLRLRPGHDEELELELGPGGAVEGRVLVPESESAAGILVKLCRGDMRVHEAVTDGEGRYALERLTPGPYMVLAERERPGEALGFLASPVETRTVDETFTFPWAVVVRSGETVRHDVDLGGGGERARVAGRLRVDGLTFGLASVQLVERTEGWWRRPDQSAEHGLAVDGSFLVEDLHVGPHWLVCQILGGELAGTRLIHAVDLVPGTNEVALELDSARVAGRIDQGEKGPCALVNELSADAFTVTPLAPEAGLFELSVAAGRLRLVAWRAGEPRDDPCTWSVLGRATLHSGGRSVIE